MSGNVLWGNGYEARQTSKEQTKMPTFMLEAQSFVFRSYTMHALRNQNVSIGKFLSTE